MNTLTPYERFGSPSPEPDAFLEEWIFRVGDTITGLAHRFYDDWRLWKVIADRNSIIDARTIAIGTQLLIPPRPLERGRYEST